MTDVAYYKHTDSIHSISVLGRYMRGKGYEFLRAIGVPAPDGSLTFVQNYEPGVESRWGDITEAVEIPWEAVSGIYNTLQRAECATPRCERGLYQTSYRTFDVGHKQHAMEGFL